MLNDDFPLSRSTSDPWRRIREPNGPLTRAAKRAGLSALGTYTAYVVHGLLHPSLLRSHATRAERREALPGDEVVVDPDWVTDFAIDIAAAPADVWPWLVQMGYGRAGYYTWYPLDNGGVDNAATIVPALQGLRVGDVIPDGPRANQGFGIWRVRELVTNRTLVLHSRRTLLTGYEVPSGAEVDQTFVDCTWLFELTETAPGSTRLHVRVRARSHGAPWTAPAARAARLVFAWGDSVMENSLIAGIRDRAEQRSR
jgi:proline iminopeptidase